METHSSDTPWGEMSKSVGDLMMVHEAPRRLLCDTSGIRDSGYMAAYLSGQPQEVDGEAGVQTAPAPRLQAMQTDGCRTVKHTTTARQTHSTQPEAPRSCCAVSTYP